MDILILVIIILTIYLGFKFEKWIKRKNYKKNKKF